MDKKCNKCGSCCKVLRIHKKYNLNDYPELKAIWLQVTSSDAFKLNPYIVHNNETLDYNFYICTNYNVVTNQCDDYENRPPTCRNYPTNKNPTKYTDNCSLL